ncbi:hypothetical protein GUJ93_ZPchr0002g26271 [Zizania palustris]|uniref:Uncharacterized protein n=1 Tax=Zizania palustris TaxID=103762 RepID=A0A8J5VRW4_ZIZPA|nr:hypothetical protein GUJ93_ZPchr0002g26271 [Zizania palustris]
MGGWDGGGVMSHWRPHRLEAAAACAHSHNNLRVEGRLVAARRQHPAHACERRGGEEMRSVKRRAGEYEGGMGGGEEEIFGTGDRSEQPGKRDQ